MPQTLRRDCLAHISQKLSCKIILMALNPNFAEWHRRRVNEFLADSMPDGLGLREIVSKLNLLPLMLDTGGCYAIQADGKVVSFLWDDYKAVRREDDARIRNIALFQGSKKYNELLALIPEKPADALQCSSCKGTGIEPFSAK
jgi:hypothetical protein